MPDELVADIEWRVADNIGCTTLATKEVNFTIESLVAAIDDVGGTDRIAGAQGCIRDPTGTAPK